MQEGDLITSIDEKKLKTINDLREYIYSKKPNDTVTLNIVRNNQNMSVDVVLSQK